MPAAVVRPVPDTHRIVAQNYQLPFFKAADWQLNRHQRGQDLYGISGFGAILPLENPSFIVATWDEGDPPLKAREVLGAFLLPAQGKITQVIDSILGSYNLVPVLNECLIHCLYRIEGPITVTNDVGVSKMRVGSKPGGHGCLLYSEAGFFQYVQHFNGLIEAPAGAPGDLLQNTDRFQLFNITLCGAVGDFQRRFQLANGQDGPLK